MTFSRPIGFVLGHSEMRHNWTSCRLFLIASFDELGGGDLFPTAASRNWLPLKRANKIYRLFPRPLGDSAGDCPYRVWQRIGLSVLDHTGRTI